MVKPYIFQVAGYQNSGKTTLVSEIIDYLTKQNMKVVTIKHHGHGGKPGIQKEKDSFRHIDAGAVASLVEGDGRLVLQAEKDTWTLEEKLRFLDPLQPDYIIIEGHKFESYPKLVLIKEESDGNLLSDLTNIKAVLYWEKPLALPAGCISGFINDNCIKKALFQMILRKNA